MRYIEFCKLDNYINEVFKKTFIAKEIYMSKLSDYINKRLANLVINKQLPT